MNPITRLFLVGGLVAGAALWAMDSVEDVAGSPYEATERMESGRPAHPVYRSPQSVCLSPDGRTAYVVNATSNSVSFIDTVNRTVTDEVTVSERPVQAALSPDGQILYVSCSWEGVVDVIDTASATVVRTLPAGYEPNGVVPSADGTRLYVVNVISEDVTTVDVETGNVIGTVPVGIQPRYAVETPDGSRLVVSNSLSRAVSIIDPGRGVEIERRDLGRSSMLRQIACTSDGRWCFVANLVSHDETPTLQLERGWIHSNGFTVMDLTRPGHRVTLLLDHLLSGAANPTGLVLSADDQRLYVSLAGIHEIAVVDVAKCLDLVRQTTPDQLIALEEDVEILQRLGIARRFDAGGFGPRSIALNNATGELFIANTFSDSVSIMDAKTGAILEVIELGPPREMSVWRKGEFLSCDARICYQNWFSCVSCHQEDGTDDGLNWDLSNDGLGNPKNAKSLLDGYDTPPAMWGGVRGSLEAAIQGGQRFEGHVPIAENHEAFVAYFGNPERAPSPYRNADPDAIHRGEQLYAAAGCTICHPAPTYTDGRMHDLGYGTPDDVRHQFDTPSIRQCYRTGPWLHDGRAPTLLSLFTEFNPDDVHGRTKGLTHQELEDLVTFIQTL